LDQIITTHNNSNKHDKRFFNRLRLHITHNQKKYPSIYAPERTYQPQNTSRRYLRIHVKNKGKKKAENCTAKLRVIPQNDEQQYPAIEDIQLAWEGKIGEVNVDTIPKKIYNRMERNFYILFILIRVSLVFQ
jgi:hypothetical protein